MTRCPKCGALLLVERYLADGRTYSGLYCLADGWRPTRPAVPPSNAERITDRWQRKAARKVGR